MRKIFWIDLASEGDASFYSDAWHEALGKENNYFVHRKRTYRHCLFFYGRFRNPSRLLSKVLFTIEVYALFSFLIIYPYSSRLFIINIYQPFRFYNYLIKNLKKRGKFVFIIIHDIVEFNNIGYPQLLLSSNAKIIRGADRIILHGGKNHFISTYGKGKIIHEVAFPIRKEYSKSATYDKLPIVSKYILFIGGYREEKGIENLLQIKYECLENLTLVIASKLPSNLTKKAREKLGDRLILLDAYIPDSFFSSLILNASFGICPYVSGTNSGVYSTFLANNIPTITSNIPLFREIFVLDDLVVKHPMMYSEVIRSLPKENTILYKSYKSKIANFVQDRDRVFKYQVDDLFTKLSE